MLHIHEDESHHYPTNARNYYPAGLGIPLPQEDESTGYGNLYPDISKADVRGVNIHSLPNIGKVLTGDSPSNYNPFGTYFGPKILNKYGSNADYFTPQAKTMMSHKYAPQPGDASSRSSPFKKSSDPDSKTMPVLMGFSSFAEKAAKITATAAEHHLDDM